MKTLRVLLASFFMVAALSSQTTVVYGQSTVGRISGTVIDSTGAVVPGASVTIVNPTTGFKQEGFTQESGVFVFPSLAPGTYNVEVRLEGFSSARQENIVLDAASTRTLQFKLSVGGLTDMGCRSDAKRIEQKVPHVLNKHVVVHFTRWGQDL